jgi:hypothetical protein
MTAPLPAPAPRAAALAGRSGEPFLDGLFGGLWRERDLAARPRLVLAALLVGALAAVVLPFRDAGTGTLLVLLGVGGTIAAADRRLRTPYHLLGATLATLLLVPVVVRDADWVVVLCVLASGAVAVTTLTEARSLPGLLVSAFAVPLAALRGLPWLGRSVTASRTATSWAPALRTVAVSGVLVAVFGLLFASADAVFARWAGSVVPDLSAPDLPLRLFLVLAVGGATLTGVYVALNPPRVEVAALPAGVPVRRTFSRCSWWRSSR